MNKTENIQSKILEIVNANNKNNEIMLEQVDMELSGLGMDSIDFIRIIVDLEEAFGLEIPDEYLLMTEMNTITKMLNIIISILEVSDSKNEQIKV